MRKARSEQERIAQMLEVLLADQQSITREIDELATATEPARLATRYADRRTWDMVTELGPSPVVVRDGVQIIAGRAD